MSEAGEDYWIMCFERACNRLMEDDQIEAYYNLSIEDRNELIERSRNYVSRVNSIIERLGLGQLPSEDLDY